jgi:hypothetical protein
VNSEVNFLYLEAIEHLCAQPFDMKIYLSDPKSSTKSLAYFYDFCAQLFGLKKLEKVGRQKLRPTPYKREINLWSCFLIKTVKCRQVLHYSIKGGV